MANKKRPEPYFRAQRGTWCVRLHGKRVTLGTDEDAAFREFHRLMSEVFPRPKPAAGHPAVVGVYEQYLDWLSGRVEEGTKRQRTYDWYRRFIQSFVRFNCPAYRVRDLTVDTLQPVHVYQWADSHPDWGAASAAP